MSHTSACWYWRNDDGHPRALANRCAGPWGIDFSTAPVTPELLVDNELFGERPTHLLTPNAAQRPQRAKHRYHVCTRKLSPDLFCCVENGVFVASPELVLAQMAQQLSLFQFVDLCMEFMGTYALRDEGHRGFATRHAPLASRERLALALQELLGRDAYRKVRLILEHAACGSRSPMETREYLLLFLPKKYGGYGLPKAEMNARIELLPEQQGETGRKYVECDLFWPEHGVAVEYDGEYDHASYKARTRDATKRNVLLTRGIRQFTITARQILDICAFDAVARDIAKAIGYKLRGFPDDWSDRRELLRHDLFESLKKRRERIR